LTNGANIYGALGANPPTLVISSTQSWNWTYLDAMIGWAEAADIKLELLWFGSDSSGSTIDVRCPYFVFKHIMVENVQADGTIVPAMVKNKGPPWGVYWYLMDKNDFSLRALEKTAVKTMMNHISTYNTANGDKKTVIGLDVNNEESVTSISEGTGGGTLYENPATWFALSKFSGETAFVTRTMWEFEANIANAVRESKYPVWTRANSNSGGKTFGVNYNEDMREAGGTSVDFFGLDPYITNQTKLFQFGHVISALGSNVNWGSGGNVAMIMVNGGSYTNSEILTLATLAGGGYYNIYDFMSSSSYSLYVPKDRGAGDLTPEPRASYVTNVVSTNYLLRSIGQDLATKLPKGAGGTDLVFFNALNITSNLTDTLWTIPISYSPTDSGGVGIGVMRSEYTLLLTTTRDGTFTVGNITTYNITSVQHGTYNSAGNWVSSGSYPYTKSAENITLAITNGTLVHIELDDPIPK
jgi:hypothetical protein